MQEVVNERNNSARVFERGRLACQQRSRHGKWLLRGPALGIVFLILSWFVVCPLRSTFFHERRAAAVVAIRNARVRKEREAMFGITPKPRGQEVSVPCFWSGCLHLFFRRQHEIMRVLEDCSRRLDDDDGGICLAVCMGVSSVRSQKKNRYQYGRPFLAGLLRVKVLTVRLATSRMQSRSRKTTVLHA